MIRAESDQIHDDCQTLGMEKRWVAEMLYQEAGKREKERERKRGGGGGGFLVCERCYGKGDERDSTLKR